MLPLVVLTDTHTHPFNGPLSRTVRVSRYQKGKINLDFTEARDSEWQWHQLGRMQVCTSLQTETTPAPHQSFYRPDALPATQPTASKHRRPNRQCVCIIRLSEALRLSTFYLIVLVSSTRKLKQVLVTDEIRESTNFWYHLNVQGSLTKRVCISYNGHFNSCAIFAQYFNDHHIYTMISKQV